MSNVTELYKELQERIHKCNDSLFEASGVLKKIMEAAPDAFLFGMDRATDKNKILTMNTVVKGVLVEINTTLTGETHV